MIWSFSNNRMFRRCPRQWFYKTVFAESRSRDEKRQEASLLGKLQTVSAWRGQIVDSVLSDFVVPELNAGRRPTLRATIAKARTLFETQKAFGLAHKIRAADFQKSQAGSEFAAFINVEYGEPIQVADFDQAWTDIENALRILWKNIELRAIVRDGERLIAQRMLLFDHFGGKVRALPDLIVFFKQRPPMIVDWKVHSFGTRDSGDQLTTYAIALSRITPHVDFPPSTRRWKAEEIELIEAQLLVDSFRKHPLTPEAISQAEERIAEGIQAMQLACEDLDLSSCSPQDFPTARNDQTCKSCCYRKICWN